MTPQWRVKLEEPRTSSNSNRQLAFEAVQSERAGLSPARGAKVVASVVMLEGMNLAGPQTNNTEKWYEVVNEVVEGGYLAKEKEKEVSAVDGGMPVCLDVGG